MDFQTHNDSDIWQADGLAGKFQNIPNGFVESVSVAFGESLPADVLADDKNQTHQWEILFDDGTYATIYDLYEAGSYRIGGDGKRAVELVCRILVEIGLSGFQVKLNDGEILSY